MGDVIPLLIGGLVLFLYAISQLSEVLKDIFDDRARETIQKYTSNVFVAILIGTILTIILDSSSAVIILTIVFINSGSLTFKQAIGIILGANIGTTFSSQIIAMDVGKYAILPLIIGLGLEIFTKNVRFRRAGRVLLYFGMLFFGLYIMEESVLPLKESLAFEEWILKIENNPIRGALVGGFVTLLIQSSSATVGLAIVLGKQNLLSLAGGLAVMLGAELGTCSDTLLATINGSRQALKAGLFHFIFNLTTILVGLALFTPFMSLVSTISEGAGLGRVIANGHMLFNIGGVILALPFLGVFERALNWMLPDQVELATAV